jgi:multisubunit Na+/H+ antiporter MnhB subunit
MDNIKRLKLIFGSAIGIIALVCGVLPQLFKKFFRRRFLWLSIANVLHVSFSTSFLNVNLMI